MTALPSLRLALPLCFATYDGIAIGETAQCPSVIAPYVLRRAVESTDCSDFAPGLQITVSIGLAARGDETHHERLVSQADARRYEAKRGGRNRTCG